MRNGLIGFLALMVLGCGGGDAGDATAPPADAAPQDSVASRDTAPDDGPPRVYEPVVFAVVSDLHIEGGFDDSISQKVSGLFLDVAGLWIPRPSLSR